MGGSQLRAAGITVRPALTKNLIDSAGANGT